VVNTNISRRKVLATVTAGIGVSTLGVENIAAQPVDEYNVGTASPAAAQAARDAANTVIRTLDWGGDEKTVTGTYSQAAIDNLDNRPDVRYTEINGTYQALGQTLPWGIDRVDADVVHSDGETGGDDTDGDGGAHISIIDTGIRYTHTDLDDNYVGGKDFVDDDDDPDDKNGHGTHVAGTTDAEDDDDHVVGICTDAYLHAARVLDANGSGSYSDVAAGIEWTADQGHDVGNMSLGGDRPSSTIEDACQHAYNKGVLLVAAAGNDDRGRVSYPARYETVIAVSAMNKNDDLASFSNTGDAVEFIAPGVDVLSTSILGDTVKYSGTSMASPHVAGAGGQLMDNGYTNEEARTRLQNTAEDIGLSSNEQGYGLVDVAAAFGGGGNSSPTVDSLSLTEVETDNSDAEFDADWSVSDDDGNLAFVDLTLTDDADGETEDTATVDVSSDTASGTTRLVASGDDGSGNSYTVELVVTDAEGASSSDTAATTESEDTGGNAPSIKTFNLTDTGNRQWARVEVDWTVFDADGDLSEVSSEAVFATGGTDSETSSISGGSASGTHELRERNGHGDADVTLTVTDGAGNQTSKTKTITLG
jgi:subtilisin